MTAYSYGIKAAIVDNLVAPLKLAFHQKKSGEAITRCKSKLFSITSEAFLVCGIGLARALRASILGGGKKGLLLLVAMQAKLFPTYLVFSSTKFWAIIPPMDMPIT